jgi:Tol biopolymer transport system component
MNLNPVWLPDGRSLLFISDRDGQRGIYFQRLATDGSAEGEPIFLPRSNDAHSMSISRDGRVLAFSAFRARQNIWRVPIPETGTASMDDAVPVTDQVQVIETFDVSPDGSMVAFDSDLLGSCDYNIFLLRDGEANPRQITSHKGNEWRPRFSPDGREIAFHAQPSTEVERDIYTVPSSGGPPQLVVSTEEREWYGEWSPDGLTIFYLRKPNPMGEVTLISRDALGGPWGKPRSMEWILGTGTGPRWTPDGRFLSYWRYGTRPPRLIQLSLEGEESVVRLPDLPGVVGMGGWNYEWSADGRTLYAQALHEDGSRGVWQIPLHGGVPRLVLKYDPEIPVVFRHATETDLYLLVGEAEADIHLLDLELVTE